VEEAVCAPASCHWQSVLLAVCSPGSLPLAKCYWLPVEVNPRWLLDRRHSGGQVELYRMEMQFQRPWTLDIQGTHLFLPYQYPLRMSKGSGLAAQHHSFLDPLANLCARTMLALGIVFACTIWRFMCKLIRPRTFSSYRLFLEQWKRI
jgi:hypothetical protein